MNIFTMSKFAVSPKFTYRPALVIPEKVKPRDCDSKDLYAIRTLQEFLDQFSHVTFKKNATLPAAFQGYGFGKAKMNTWRHDLRDIYDTDLTMQCVKLKMSVLEFIKVYGLINTTAENQYPTPNNTETLPFVMIKILQGLFNDGDFRECSYMTSKPIFTTNKGHSWIDRKVLVDKFIEWGFGKAEIDAYLELFAFEQNGKVMYAEYYYGDLALRDTLIGLGAASPYYNIEREIVEANETLSPDQVETVYQTCNNNVNFTNAPAGTGKTFTANQTPKLLNINLSHVLCLTPTNKAALVVNQTALANSGSDLKIGNRTIKISGAKTVHSIGYQLASLVHHNNYIMGENKVKSHIEILVLDEASMYGSDTSGLIALIIQALKIKKVIFLGDENQLPPVGLGSLLDTIKEAKVKVNSLTTCHRSNTSIFELSKTLLTTGQISIANQHVHKVTPTDTHQRAYSKDKFYDEKTHTSIIKSYNPNFLRTMNSLLQEKWDKVNKSRFVAIAYTQKMCIDLTIYMQMMLMNDNMLEIHNPIDRKTVLPYKSKEWIQEFNRIVKVQKKSIQNPSNFEPYKELLLETTQIGDVVISTSNNTDSKIFPKNARGEIINMTCKNDKFRIWTYDVMCFDNQKILKDIPADELKLNYTSTVHSSQGGQADTVVYVKSDMDSLELAYTAITRAKDNLYIFVDADTDRINLEHTPTRISTFNNNNNSVKK